MDNKYVILTGSKNNAGDFLIKHRAKNMLSQLRSDREIVDFNAWEPLNNEQLNIINNSKALILTGGPSLQTHMRPYVFRMVDDLSEIKVPIITYGVGWMSNSGSWNDTQDYKISNQSLELLDRISNSGFKSSVRDYHTLNLLESKGLNNFIMTGCPAYYDFDHLNKEFSLEKEIKKISFSLGVSFVRSKSMEEQMKSNILTLKEMYPNKIIEVVFHHSLDEKKFLNSYNHDKNHIKKHKKFEQWLNKLNIDYVDISGSAENLIEYYEQTDLHIGYRVHAHIFMSSISKPSIMLTEDGRGKALDKVIGGISFDGYVNYSENIGTKILKKMGIKYDQYKHNIYLSNDIKNILNYEIENQFPRTRKIRSNINDNFIVMKKFIEQLP